MPKHCAVKNHEFEHFGEAQSAENHSIEESSHSVEAKNKKQKQHNRNNPGVWYFKPNRQFGCYNQLEALSSELFRFLLTPEQVPKVRAVYEQYGNYQGTVSKKLDNFTSMYRNNEVNSIAKAIDYGMGELLAAHLFLQEEDCHDANIGLITTKDGQRKLARIDFDRALFPLIKEKIIQSDQQKIFKNSNLKRETRSIYDKFSNNIENLTSDDIDCVAKTCQNKISGHHKNPVAAVLKYGGDTVAREFENNRQFQLNVLRTLIKAVMLDNDKIQQLVNLHISNTPLNRGAYKHLCDRRNKLITALKKSSQFQFLFTQVSDYNQIYQQIQQEVEQFNEALKQNNRIPIDNEDITKTLDMLINQDLSASLKQIHNSVNSLADNLSELNHQINADAKASEDVEKFLKNDLIPAIDNSNHITLFQTITSKFDDKINSVKQRMPSVLTMACHFIANVFYSPTQALQTFKEEKQSRKQLQAEKTLLNNCYQFFSVNGSSDDERLRNLAGSLENATSAENVSSRP